MLIACTSFVEVVSIGAVLPFLGLLTAPERVFAHPFAQYIIQPLGIESAQALLLPMTVIFAAIAFLSGFMRLLLLWVQTRLSHAIGSDFSLGMYRRTLYQAYSVHLARNSSEVIAGISNKAKAIVGSTLLPLMVIISSVMLLGTIFVALLSLEPMIALIAFSGFGIIYAVVILATKRRMLRYSQAISQGHNDVVRVLQEGLGGIRDVLIDGTQDTYCNIYQAVDAPMRQAMANVQIISISPRYGVEALGMVLISALAYLLTLSSSGIASAIPVLGALAMGAQRMLPMLQQAYSSWASIRSGQISLSDALDLMDQPLPPDADKPSPAALRFNNSIVLRNVSFTYTPEKPEVLRCFDISIAKGCRLGIVGSTGSGKSTFLDIFMGLLSPTQGEMLVDGQKISAENRRAWQAHIAHVPQSIFLSDASIAENIALGVPKAEIDWTRLRAAAEKAQIADVIAALEDGYDTRVGERGVRLSGGQRQRIGIARALYKNADVIVFDEATSALDSDTERKVMQAINTLGNNLTLIIVAHRVSTLKNCDQIIEIGAGRVERTGTYDEIICP
ncbi:MAG: ABC transporter ATP-binding protein [Pseudomonadota bacterium]